MPISQDVTLTPEQLESVNYSGGDLLIRGVAGSGKSVVLMSRAVNLNKKANMSGEDVKILILTYTNALVKYTEKLVDLVGLRPNHIKLEGIDSLIWNCCIKMGYGWIDILKDEDKPGYVEKALNAHLAQSTNRNDRLYTVDIGFWVDEFDWMMQKAIWDGSAYMEAERTGRGTRVRLSREDRTMVFEVYTLYRKLIKDKKKCTFEDLYQFVWDRRTEIPDEYIYDYVLIDEAQDLSFIQLRFARTLAKKSVTVAADNAQKIYNKSFAWRDIGIDIRGRASKKLSTTFRNTVEIWQLAESLQNVNRSIRDDTSDYTDSDAPSVSGRKPRVFVCSNAADENNLILSLARAWIREGMKAGILYRTYNEGKILQYQLHQANIPFEQIRKGSEWDITRPGIKLCTMHSSKGLEFDAVLIPFFNASTMPSPKSIEGAEGEDLTEKIRTERSLLYVSMTRAKTSLTLSYCGTPSPFLGEFEHRYYDHIGTDNREHPKPSFTGVTKEQLDVILASRNRPQQRRPEAQTGTQPASQAVRYAGVNDIKSGVKVEHKTYGKGTIEKVRGIGRAKIVEIYFEKDGLKKLGYQTIVDNRMLKLI